MKIFECVCYVWDLVCMFNSVWIVFTLVRRPGVARDHCNTYKVFECVRILSSLNASLNTLKRGLKRKQQESETDKKRHKNWNTYIQTYLNVWEWLLATLNFNPPPPLGRSFLGSRLWLCIDEDTACPCPVALRDLVVKKWSLSRLSLSI